MRWPAPALAGLLLVASCAGKKPAAKAIEVPERTATAGDALLGVLPTGADLIVELDVGRLRDNAVVGPLIAALRAVPRATLGAWVARTGDGVEIALALLTGADAAVLASYEVGSAGAATLIVLRGESDLLATHEIGDGLRVVGPEAWVGRARAVAAGTEASLADDRALMAIRAAAMPERATAAWLRVAARFDFEARVSLASRFDLQNVPTRISGWADVVDDLAAIVLAGGDKPGEAKLFASTLRRYLRRLTRAQVVRFLGLQGSLEKARVDADGALARAIVVVSPKRLEQVTDALVKALSPAQRSTPPEAE